MEHNQFLEDCDFSATAPYTTLKSLGLGFVDVGVRDGIHPIVNPVAGLTSALAFEPDQVECARLQNLYASSTPWKEVWIEPSALYESNGTKTLHITSASTNTSLRHVHDPFVARYEMEKFQPIGMEQVTTRTLDDVLATQFASHPQLGEFIKLDTQGTEFEILMGARKTLTDRTVALLVEVWYCQTYDGQKLFSDIEIFLRSLGFSFYGASVHYRSRKFLNKRQHITKERPLWADAVFFRDPLPGSFVPISLNERQVHVLFTCAMLLGSYDFALELAQSTWADGKEHDRIARFVHKISKVSRWDAVLSALKLAGEAVISPKRAQITLGKFIDARRDVCNYEEV